MKQPRHLARARQGPAPGILPEPARRLQDSGLAGRPTAAPPDWPRGAERRGDRAEQPITARYSAPGMQCGVARRETSMRSAVPARSPEQAARMRPAVLSLSSGRAVLRDGLSHGARAAGCGGR